MIDLNIYIGSNMVRNQAENIVAVVTHSLPYGKYDLYGEDKSGGVECFILLNTLGNYVSDWIDIVGADNVSATIYLNTLSLKKVFYGIEIVNVINSLEQRNDYKTLRNFNFLQETK